VGLVNGNNITWSRELNSFESGTLMLGAKSIIEIAKDMEERISQPIIMPVLAYYSTGRLWNNLIERKTKGEGERPVASRLRAYKSCLQAKSTFKIFLQWYKGKEQSAIQRRGQDISLRVIKKLIAENLPNCKNIFYEFDEDKIQGLKLETLDGKILPFEYLSDGTRNLFALLADIAYKCLVLNPHLKDNALRETPGIILIDELDLHLHPDWQKQIVKSLKSAFGNIQFVTTSHSPFLIQEMAEGQLLKLKENHVLVTGADQLSIEDIAQYEQEIENPQWSEKKKELFKAAEEYYSALEKGQVNEDLEIKMSELIKPFSQNQAYDAFMQQIKLTKQKKDETGN
jgi:predicted ATP-binding protein involved in virulence